MEQYIHVAGARVNNLKNVTVDIPRDKFVVITGLSGSGKSSLAFDTLYAEGQRRYVESLSAYARQFLGQMDKPDVDYIGGLSPAISIDQKTTSRNPRSTVGTVTEIYDYLRLLFARIGIPHCPQCGKVIERQSPQQIADKVLELPEGTKFMILAPVVRGRKGEHKNILETVRRAGYVRVKVDDHLYTLDEEIQLDKKKKHSISVVVDRLVARPSLGTGKPAHRFSGNCPETGGRDRGHRRDRRRNPCVQRKVRLCGMWHQPAGNRTPAVFLQCSLWRLPGLHGPGPAYGVRSGSDHSGQDETL